MALSAQLNPNAVQKVTFYHSGNQVIGADADGSNGWNHAWKGAAAGHYTVTAVAEGSAGQLIASVNTLAVATCGPTADRVAAGRKEYPVDEAPEKSLLVYPVPASDAFTVTLYAPMVQAVSMREELRSNG